MLRWVFVMRFRYEILKETKEILCKDIRLNRWCCTIISKTEAFENLLSWRDELTRHSDF